MKPLGWTLIVVGIALVVCATAMQMGLLLPWGERWAPSPILAAAVGLLLFCAGYGVMRLSRR